VNPLRLASQSAVAAGRTADDNNIIIVTTPSQIQDYINSAIQTAVVNYGLTGPSQSNKDGDEKPVTVKELCAFLGVTEATVIRYRQKGRIPFMKLGSRILFNKSAVMAALESKKK